MKNIDFGALSSSTSADTLGSYQFKLSDLPEVASYTGIFDQYRFRQVELMFMWTNQPVSATTTLVRSPPIYTSVDYDDNGTPASLATVLNYGNCRFHSHGKDFNVSFQPASIAASFLAAGTWTGADVKTGQWHDCAFQTIVHYGLKYALPSYNQISALQVIARFTIDFRNVR